MLSSIPVDRPFIFSLKAPCCINHISNSLWKISIVVHVILPVMRTATFWILVIKGHHLLIQNFIIIIDINEHSYVITSLTITLRSAESQLFSDSGPQKHPPQNTSLWMMCHLALFGNTVFWWVFRLYIIYPF